MGDEFSMVDGYYDEIASSYNELHKAEQLHKLEFIKKYFDENKISIDKSTKVLDVGCGTGFAQTFFEENYNADTFGIDPSEGLIKQNDYQCALGEAEDLQFEDNEFDIVISLTALQNFQNVDYGLQEIKRVGKEFFIITFLKESQRAKEFEDKIKEKFEVIEKIEEDKDLIFILK